MCNSVHLFYHPDGAVMVYTLSYPPSSSSAPLGTGSDHVDKCLMSRKSNSDLDGGCLEAMREFLRATADRPLQVSPRHVVVIVWGTDSDAKDAGDVMLINDDNDDEDDDKDEKAGTRRRVFFS